MKESEHICRGCIDRAHAAGYDAAIQRISNLRDIEKTQQELSDMTQRHDFLMGMLKRLVHDRFYPGSGVWAEAEEIASTAAT